MKLLVITQKIDKSDPVLGFFHRWVEEFAKSFEVIVICLEKGEYSLPVPVYALGKGRLKVLGRLYKLVFNLDYDAVFVHMNQEYILAAGFLWRLMGKKVYLWRNHAKGNFLTDMAVWFSTKVFYTSPASYTARFKKSVQMPVGVDTEFFRPNPAIQQKGTVLFLGRISPVKKVLEFTEWAKKTNYRVTVAGPILDRDREYGEKVLKSLGPDMKYVGPVTHEESLKLYQTHEIYANFTLAGSFDKTILEALACGCKLEVRNPAAQSLKAEEHSLKALMDKFKKVIQYSNL